MLGFSDSWNKDNSLYYEQDWIWVFTIATLNYFSESSFDSNLSPSRPHATITNENNSELEQKSSGFFSSWLRRKWNSPTSETPSSRDNNT